MKKHAPERRNFPRGNGMPKDVVRLGRLRLSGAGDVRARSPSARWAHGVTFVSPLRGSVARGNVPAIAHCKILRRATSLVAGREFILPLPATAFPHRLRVKCGTKITPCGNAAFFA